jgi:hypothetical protein
MRLALGRLPISLEGKNNYGQSSIHICSIFFARQEGANRMKYVIGIDLGTSSVKAFNPPADVPTTTINLGSMPEVSFSVAIESYIVP